jgi:hypothetical protein
MKKIITLVLAGLAASCVQPGGDIAGTPGNRNPVIHSLLANPIAVNVNSSATITVVASDPDNQPLSYQWLASTGDIIGEGASVQFSASFCCRGPNYVEVTVKDNAGGSATKQVDVFVN